jgi:molybdopterin synthase sulfur carrier subunit
MSVKVRIPQPLQKLTGNRGQVDAAGADIKSLIADLSEKFPGIQERICDESGKVRRFINVYVNDEDIRFLQGDATALKPGDEVSIVPAIAGGGK